MEQTIEGADSHITMIRHGEPTRFETPPFTDTVIRWFGLNSDGEFIQNVWSPERITAWRATRERWQRFERRTRWLRRLTLRLLPEYTHDGRDENGDNLGRSWKLVAVGPAISRRLEPQRPGPFQTIDFHDCVADAFEIVGTQGLVARNLLDTGNGGRPFSIGLPA